MASKAISKSSNVIRSSKWKVGERVLCCYPEGEIFYEAKIIGVSSKENDSFTYKVHYQGWNSRYDEKIAEEDAKLRFRPFTEKDAEKAKEKIKQALQQKKGKKQTLKKSPHDSRQEDSEASFSSLPIAITVDTPLKKAGKNVNVQLQTQSKIVDEVYEPQKKKVGKSETFDLSPGLRSGFHPFEVTTELGNILKLDHYLIKDQFFLPILPAPVTVFQIIDKFRKKLEKEAVDELNDLNGVNEIPSFVNEELEGNIEFVLGIVDFFDASLGKQLLYDFERARHLDYFKVINKDVPKEVLGELLFLKSTWDVDTDDPTFQLRMSRHYGLAHLLRLLVKFPEMISTMLPCNERTIKLVKQRLDRLMEFLHNNWSKFYLGQNDYKPASLQYMSRLESFRKEMKLSESVGLDFSNANKENVFYSFVLKDQSD